MYTEKEWLLKYWSGCAIFFWIKHCFGVHGALVYSASMDTLVENVKAIICSIHHSVITITWHQGLKLLSQAMALCNTILVTTAIAPHN